MIFYSQLGTGTNFTNFGHHFRLTRIFELVKLVPVPSCVFLPKYAWHILHFSFPLISVFFAFRKNTEIFGNIRKNRKFSEIS